MNIRSLSHLLRLLPLAGFLLGAPVLFSSCGDTDKKPAAGKKAGKKKGKKKKKKAKKARKAREEASTSAETEAAAKPATAPAETAAETASAKQAATPTPLPAAEPAAKPAPQKAAEAPAPLPSEQPVKTPATPEETMHAFSDLDSEVKCITDSALSPEEKQAAYQKLLPHAVAIGAAAHKAGGFEEIRRMLGDYGQKLYAELQETMQKNNLSRQDIEADPELLPAAFRAFWKKWEDICAHYKVNPNRLMPGGFPKEAGAIALALRGASAEDLIPASDATVEDIEYALLEYDNGLKAALSGDATPDAKAEALLRLNNGLYKYVLAMHADNALYRGAYLRHKGDGLKALDKDAMEASDYEGSPTLKSAVQTTIYLWRDVLRELHRTQPPMRW